MTAKRSSFQLFECPEALNQARRSAKRNRWVLGLVFSFCIAQETALAQSQIAIPGNPNGDLNTELLQALSAARGMELTLQNVIKSYPRLRVEALAAQSSWQYSPFARGARFIEKDIEAKGGKEGAALLASLNTTTQNVLNDHVQIDTEKAAREFIQLVGRRAKGEIEVPMVRANLLWNCPDYQKQPEKEIADGYVVGQESKYEGVVASMKWPMSWKPDAARNVKILQKYRSHWSHGKLSGMLRIDRMPLAPGQVLGPNQYYEETTRELAELEIGNRAKLLLFSKTQVNGNPVILTTIFMEMEQFGIPVRIVGFNLQTTHRDMSVTTTLTVGLATDDKPEEKMKQYEPLFQSLASSLQVKFEESKQ